MIVIKARQGIGLDIEYNEDICHIVDVGEENDVMYAFSGAIIMLPFVKMYMGHFEPLGEMK